MRKQDELTQTLTPASEWRSMQRDGVVITLQSSGRTVRLRSVQLARLLKAGQIPDPLTAYVASMIYGGDEDETRTAAQKAIEWQDYLDLVATVALMHPRVVENPQNDDEIAIEDLEYAELIEIHGWARNPLDAVRPFRQQETANVGVGTESRESIETT